MLDAALGYLGRGWSVVPGHTIGNDGLCSCRQPDCDRPGKHPRVKWTEFQSRLATETEVRYWWKRWPEANVIIITGALSGIVAVDLDPRHGGDDAWRRWKREHPVAETVTSLTGGGGQHLIFRHPGREVRNTINMLSPGKDQVTGRPRESGVDFRGDGGYIVAPPSRHESGRTYEWDSTGHPDDVPIAAMSPALVMLVLRGLQQPGHEDRPFDIEAYVTRGEEIPESTRNTTMARITGYFASVVDGKKELDLLCASVNQRCCKPPLAERELSRIEGSIWRRELASRAAKKQQEGVDVQKLVSDLGPESDPLEIATTIWISLGVSRVVDWFMLIGEHIEYVLVTPEDEIRIPDLLDNDTVRRIVLNRTGALIPIYKRGSFDDIAKVLRSTAREVIVEPRLAEDRVAEWVDAYSARHGFAEVPEDQREASLQQGPIMIDGVRHMRVHRFATFVYNQFGEELRTREMRGLLRRAGWEPAPEMRGTWRQGSGKKHEDAEMVRGA